MCVGRLEQILDKSVYCLPNSLKEFYCTVDVMKRYPNISI